MNEKDRQEVIEALKTFVINVARDKSATPAELEALPELAKLLLSL